MPALAGISPVEQPNGDLGNSTIVKKSCQPLWAGITETRTETALERVGVVVRLFLFILFLYTTTNRFYIFN